MQKFKYLVFNEHAFYIFNQPGVHSRGRLMKFILKRYSAVTEEPIAFIFENSQKEEEINIRS